MIQFKTAEGRSAKSPPLGARTILLFTRAPEDEARVKGLPVPDGARLFEAFLRGWTRRAAEASAELIVVAPSGSQTALSRLLPGVTVETQQGPTFGARVEAAFAMAFDHGAGSVVMVGGDGPPLARTDLLQAFGHLERHERALVLAPAEDGGVNAIGFNAFAARPLDRIAWLSRNVFAQLQSAAADVGLELLLTQSGRDLDRARDLRALYSLSRGENGWSVFRWLLRALLRPAIVLSSAPQTFTTRWIVDSRITRGPPSPLLVH